MDISTPPEDQELRNVIDKLAQFVARNGPEFEKMTMEKQKDNPKFSFLFGGEYFGYYKYKLAIEQQQHSAPLDDEYKMEAVLCKSAGKEVADVPAPMTMLPPPPIPPTTPSMEELIQQSQWNLQQQEQHLLSLRQEQVTAAISLAMEQQMQKLLVETQLDMNEFDNLLQPIIDTCTKDAISAGKNWMFSNAKTPPHCELMASHLRNRITADTAHFELRLHLIYLTNDVLHHCQRKNQRDLLAALQKVVVPIYCTSFLAVEEDKQQKITRLLQLWEKNGYFDDITIQQLQSPALGLGQYQASLITEYAPVVQPVQMAFQQQIQTLKTQHEEFVNNLKQQQTAAVAAAAAAVGQLTPADAEVKTQAPLTSQPADLKPPLAGPPPSDYEGAQSRPSDSNPAASSDIPSSKPGWFDPQHNMPSWNPQQPPPFDPSQAPPPCPPWNSHEGMWNEQRDPNWSGPRDGGPGGPGGPTGPTGPWSSQNEPPPSWSGQFDQPPWSNQPDQPPPWGQREPPFRMQRPPHFRGPFPPHQQPPPFNQPPPPHNFGRFPPRFMQDEFPPRHHFERPPYPPHRFDYPQGDFPGEIGPPPHHHPNQRIPPPGMSDPPPWGGNQHPDFGPPPHGFNGQAPHMRRQNPSHVNQDDPSLVPNVPYFDLPAGLMAPLVKLEDHDYKPLDPKDIRLPPPMPPSDRLLAAVEAFYSPPSHDRPRNSEGWEQNGLYEFFRAKMRARRKKEQDKRNSSTSGLGSGPAALPVDLRLGEENKGHQMLMKMGWSGSGGLGAKEQGIQDPIKGGDIRDKWDQYKGVGVPLDDPYVNYRRNKSYNFVARMKAREKVSRDPQEPSSTE
ncbi:calcium homeostasis endoplasmic reticulum isoform X1 [Labeo rohita]|uniref:Calcium homeostasis endoplasmic reticulum protein n=1 Tax=Labeo rohita TaxID=84645 RepID=A0A498LU48_LABRO|nr:calcium homeostasis endoplasmic reticulum isoform X1 [Labeo rohita]